MSQTQTVLSLNDYIARMQYALSESQLDEAQHIGVELVAAYPENVDAQFIVGNVYFQLEQYERAIDHFVKAIKLNEHHQPSREYLLFSLYLVKNVPFSDDLRFCFSTLLKNPEGLNSDLLVREWAMFLVRDPETGYIQKSADMAYSEFKDWWESLSASKYEEIISDSLINGMILNVVSDIKIEKFLTYCRNYLLEYVQGKLNGQGLSPAEPSYEKLALALSLCCYNSDYIFSVSEEEKQLLDNVTQPENIKRLDALSVAVISSYEALYKFDRIALALSKMLSPISGKKKLKQIIAQQIVEPKERQKLASEIEKISSIEDVVSQDVRNQYEENPYPRWNLLKGVHKDEIEERLIPLDQDGLQILIAGCATGAYPINVASAYPKAQITGIDLSLSSLCYAKSKADAFNVRNIDFYHGDILKAVELKKTFDVIETVGVLHHMREPDKGLSSLLGCLSDDGYIKIGLYSATARSHVTQCQKALVDMGLKPTIDGIRAAREYILSLPSDHPYRKMEGYTDFYNASMLRDLLFHVQEHCYDISGIKDMLDRAGLEFIGFSNIGGGEAKAAYSEKYPDDLNMNSLDNWQEFEEENPDTFIGMYNFWCKRK